MAYNPVTDFIGLLRQTGGGVRAERMPGLDYVVSALARAGMFQVSVGQVAPVANQQTTIWIVPAPQSWSAESSIFLWNPNSAEYEPASSALWSVLFSAATIPGQVTQSITAPGPAAIAVNAGVVLVKQTISAPITLNMPLAAAKIGSVLISDWKGDAGEGNTITDRKSVV